MHIQEAMLRCSIRLEVHCRLCAIYSSMLSLLFFIFYFLFLEQFATQMRAYAVTIMCAEYRLTSGPKLLSTRLD